MNEIKFRVLLSNGEWKYFIFPNDLSEGIYLSPLECNPESFTQCTGLKDKNKKEICNGDIVKTIDTDDYKKPFDIIKEVKTNNGLLCPFYEFDTREEYFGDLFEWEVIGNIYENPNLLK